MNYSQPTRIASATVVGDSAVELRFSDGFVGRVDLRLQLWGPIFEPLTDPRVFRQLRVEDDTIRWPNGADFCPDVLRFWCESGEARDQAATDAHFAAVRNRESAIRS